MFARLLSRFRKHSFDLDNPTIVNTGTLTTKGDKEFIYTKFHCTRCDKTLALNKQEMEGWLPRSMSHGCNPSSNQSLS